TLNARRIRDIFGNDLSSAQKEFIYYRIETAEPGDIVINEFMYSPPEEYTRYIELYKSSGKAVHRSVWTQMNDRGKRRILTTERVRLTTGEYMVLLPYCHLLSQFPDRPAINAGTAFGALKTGGDNIIIANAAGVVIDSLSYRPSWGGS